MKVVDLIREQDEAKSHHESFILWPKLWGEYNLPIQFDWRVCCFKEAEAQNVPDRPGIYTFLIQPRVALHPCCSYLMYVGKTSRSLRKRFTEYLNEKRSETGRPKIVRLLNKYPEHLHFCCSALELGASLGKVEDALIASLMPPYNDQFPAKVRRIIRGLM